MLSALRRAEAESSGAQVAWGERMPGEHSCCGFSHAGLLALPRFAAMGEQHQVHVWENTYIMAPKASTIPHRPPHIFLEEARMTRRCCRRKSRQSSRTSWKATCRTEPGGTRAGPCQDKTAHALHVVQFIQSPTALALTADKFCGSR